MENEIITKRGLVVILVIATVVIFVGLVWLIATYLPWYLLGIPSPSGTAGTRAEMNCTYPVSYWKKHPELYPAQMVIGGEVYNDKDLEVILSDGTQNPSQQIQTQLAGAFLNFLAGADQSSIETTIFEAYGWLIQHPEGSQIPDGELVAGTRLFNVLEAYNLGLTGVAPCEASSSLSLTETSTATETPTVLFTLTPSQTITSTPSETPTPTSSETMPFPTLIVPSQTPIPMITEPGGSTTTPKPTLAPPATNTPIIPTEAPTATRTSPPPATPTYTPPPPPTPTYTPPPLPSPTYTPPLP
jgi:hypothetical protein